MHCGEILVEPSKKISEVVEANQFSTEHPLIKNALKNIEGLSFEETHKTAYSHGLESIYALENVDLKTVRRLGGDEKKPEAPKQFQVIIEEFEEPQLQLDLGDEWKGKIESFVPQEPIQVLGLAKPAEKCLLEQGKTRLKDLIQADLRSFIFFKGMGQGHLEEIKQKLAHYLQGRSINRSSTVDFHAWIRSLIATYDRKKMFVLFESYGLSEMIALNAAEAMEVRRLTVEKRQDWVKEAIAFLSSEEIATSVKRDIQSIVNILVKPWIRERGGLATLCELEERLLQISPGQNISRLVMAMFGDLYFSKQFPLGSYLSFVDGNYAVDQDVASCYWEIINRTMSYFYHPEVKYALLELVAYLEKEMALNWHGYRDGTVAKVLRMSPKFRVRKGSSHQLMIWLA